jgi:hypothetical protein
VEQAADRPATDEQRERFDRLCLDMLVSLLDHRLKESHYKSVLLSGLAVMGLREDGGWVAAQDYTTNYSAVIKLARMVVVRQGYLERKDEVAERMQRMDEQQAQAEARGLFQIVREKVQRFMTLVTATTEPTPMDWMFDARSYGFRIQYTTAADGMVDWQGDRISFHRIQFTMGQLSDMITGWRRRRGRSWAGCWAAGTGRRSR